MPRHSRLKSMKYIAKRCVHQSAPKIALLVDQVDAKLDVYNDVAYDSVTFTMLQATAAEAVALLKPLAHVDARGGRTTQTFLWKKMFLVSECAVHWKKVLNVPTKCIPTPAQLLRVLVWLCVIKPQRQGVIRATPRTDLVELLTNTLEKAHSAFCEKHGCGLSTATVYKSAFFVATSMKKPTCAFRKPTIEDTPAPELLPNARDRSTEVNAKWLAGVGGRAYSSWTMGELHGFVAEVLQSWNAEQYTLQSATRFEKNKHLITPNKVTVDLWGVPVDVSADCAALFQSLGLCNLNDRGSVLYLLKVSIWLRLMSLEHLEEIRRGWSEAQTQKLLQELNMESRMFQAFQTGGGLKLLLRLVVEEFGVQLLGEKLWNDSCVWQWRQISDQFCKKYN